VEPEPFGHCPVCGERIGAYEPLALLLPGGAVLRGGLLSLRDQLAQGLLHHEACLDDAVRRP
jgi:hypothetical protein